MCHGGLWLDGDVTWNGWGRRKRKLPEERHWVRLWTCFVQGYKSYSSISSTRHTSRRWHDIVNEVQRRTRSSGSQTQEVGGATEHSEWRHVVREASLGIPEGFMKVEIRCAVERQVESGNRGPHKQGERILTCLGEFTPAVPVLILIVPPSFSRESPFGC